MFDSLTEYMTMMTMIRPKYAPKTCRAAVIWFIRQSHVYGCVTFVIQCRPTELYSLLSVISPVMIERRVQ